MMIVRASQNGPYLTVKFEAKTQEKYNLLKSAFFPEEKDFSKIELNYFFNYVDTKEEFTDVHSIKKYSQNQAFRCIFSPPKQFQPEEIYSG